MTIVAIPEENMAIHVQEEDMVVGTMEDVTTSAGVLTEEDVDVDAAVEMDSVMMEEEVALEELEVTTVRF